MAYVDEGQPISNEDWQAENDAGTLAEAKAIMDDEVRLNKAKAAAAKMADEKLDAVKSLLEVSGRPFNQTYKGFEIS